VLHALDLHHLVDLDPHRSHRAREIGKGPRSQRMLAPPRQLKRGARAQVALWSAVRDPLTGPGMPVHAPVRGDGPGESE